MNRYIDTVIVAPMTTKGRGYPTPHPLHLSGQDWPNCFGPNSHGGQSAPCEKLGVIDKRIQSKVLSVLQDLFAA